MPPLSCRNTTASSNLRTHSWIVPPSLLISLLSYNWWLLPGKVLKPLRAKGSPSQLPSSQPSQKLHVIKCHYAKCSPLPIILPSHTALSHLRAVENLETAIATLDGQFQACEAVKAKTSKLSKMTSSDEAKPSLGLRYLVGTNSGLEPCNVTFTAN